MSKLEKDQHHKLTDLQSDELIQQFEGRLIAEWLQLIQKNRVSDIRDPVINEEKLLDLLLTARQSGRPLVMVAIGCQDWIKPEWGDPHTDRLMGRISPHDKRASRFIQEMSGFSQALSSFQIPHRIHFSLSDIEALIHMELNNMGLVIHNPDQELLETNVVDLAAAIQAHGGMLEPFIHSQVLQQLLRFADLQSYQELLTGKLNPSYREFLDKEYEVDLRVVARSFVQQDELGPVWLDIQSFNFEDDVISFAQTAEAINPDMPILSIFPNAGNWHGRAKPHGVFPQRVETLVSLLELNQMPQDEVDWVRKLRKAKNEPLQQLVSEMLSEVFTISSAEEKMFAVRIVCLLALGFDPMPTESDLNEK